MGMVTIKEKFDYHKWVDFYCIKIPNGPKLNFISLRQSRIISYKITLSIALGGAHLAYKDNRNNNYSFSKGMAHFIEHLIAHQLRISFQQLKNIVSSNAITTHDRIIITIIVFVDSAQVFNIIYKILEKLLQIPEFNFQKETCLHEKAIINLEIDTRQSEWDYIMFVKSFESLFPNDPMGFDLLGTKKSLEKIQDVHINQALNIIKSNLLAISIVGKDIPDKFIDKVITIIRQKNYTDHENPSFQLLPPETIPKTKTPFMKAELNNFATELVRVIVGIRFLPLHLISFDKEQLIRLNLMSCILANYIRPFSFIHLQQASVFLISGIEKDYFFLDHYASIFVERNYKSSLIQKLEGFKRNMEHETVEAFSKILDRRSVDLLALSQSTDYYEHSVLDLLTHFNLITSKDVDKLINELLQTTNITLVYGINPQISAQLSFLE
jgi:hypothetical protein